MDRFVSVKKKVEKCEKNFFSKIQIFDPLPLPHLLQILIFFKKGTLTTAWLCAGQI